MEVRINKLGLFSLVLGALIVKGACAAEISKNTAQMQAMDKVTGQVSLIEVPVNGEVRFGSFSIVVRDCKTRPEEEIPENFAFVDVADTSFDASQVNVFKGWMISSSPALNAVEHPIYDVWLLKCVDTDLGGKTLLTAEQLRERDELPRLVDNREVILPETLFIANETTEEETTETEVLLEPEVVEIDDNDIRDIIIQQDDGAPKSLLDFADEPVEETQDEFFDMGEPMEDENLEVDAEGGLLDFSEEEVSDDMVEINVEALQ